MSPELKVIFFGSHGHVQKSENHANAGFSGFSKLNENELVPNEVTLFYGACRHTLFFKFTVNMAPQTPDHKPVFFLDFLGSYMGDLLFLSFSLGQTSSHA